MKLTSLTISPSRNWEAPGEKNPLKAVVKLATEQSTIECVLSEESMHRMIEVCADEIAKQAQARVGEFVSAVTQIDAGKSDLMIEGN